MSEEVEAATAPLVAKISELEAIVGEQAAKIAELEAALGAAAAAEPAPVEAELAEVEQGRRNQH